MFQVQTLLGLEGEGQHKSKEQGRSVERMEELKGKVTGRALSERMYVG